MPEKVNPLFSKNIPPPPAPMAPTVSPIETPKREISQALSDRPAPRSPARSREQATVEVSLYLRPSQDDKLEDLRRAYKRHTGQKISANEVVRRLIDRAGLENLI